MEHAAREAVVRAQQGDSHPKDLLLSEPVRSVYASLLADREPLVWRHAAVARGLLSAVDSGLREEIDSALDPNLSPTEWRRAAVSLVSTMPSDPDGAYRACRALIEGPIAALDPGIVATLVFGLPRAIEAEPVKFGDWSAPLHISWGVREITQDAEPEAIVAEADAAMYARKRDRKSA